MRKVKPFGLITGNLTRNERKWVLIQIALVFSLPQDCLNFVSYTRCLFKGIVYGTGSYYCNLKIFNESFYIMEK